MYKIAIAGKANSGKNTLGKLIANALKEQLNKNILKIKYLAFADPIKQMAQIMYPELPSKTLFGASHLRNTIIPNAFDNEGAPLTIRKLLIDLGTNGRKYNESIWIDVLGSSLKKYESEKDVAIITDVRFIDEFEYLKKKDCFIIKIIRDNKTIINHASETEQDSIPEESFNYIINNDEGIDKLRKEAYKIAKLLK